MLPEVLVPIWICIEVKRQLVLTAEGQAWAINITICGNSINTKTKKKMRKSVIALVLNRIISPAVKIRRVRLYGFRKTFFMLQFRARISVKIHLMEQRHP